jgi:hypothetical protein
LLLDDVKPRDPRLLQALPRVFQRRLLECLNRIRFHANMDMND